MRTIGSATVAAILSVLAVLTIPAVSAAQQPNVDTLVSQALIDSVLASPLAVTPADVPDLGVIPPRNCEYRVVRSNAGVRVLLAELCQGTADARFRTFDIRSGRQPALLTVLVVQITNGTTISSCKLWYNKGLYYGSAPTKEFESRTVTRECLEGKPFLEVLVMYEKLLRP